ncbi:MAG: DNA repair protein RecO [Coxiellaceae bacterium]|jgi:DNA repair protein RecO (recombination protein O)|nr:DNA repair protein RecO [Coxiellaceae bacterium]
MVNYFVNKVSLESAYVLHSKPYSDTSLLVELFTKHYGKFTVIAKSARGIKSRFKGALMPFIPLLVTCSGKSDLKTLQQVEISGIGVNLKNYNIFNGFYLNELLIRLLPSHEACSSVFDIYQNTLSSFTNVHDMEVALRLFEKCLLVNLGYGLQLDRTYSNEPILAEEQYGFKFGYGFYRSTQEFDAKFSGKSLLALNSGDLVDKSDLKEVKLLLRRVITILLGNNKLKSRDFYKPMS